MRDCVVKPTSVLHLKLMDGSIACGYRSPPELLFTTITEFVGMFIFSCLLRGISIHIYEYQYIYAPSNPPMPPPVLGLFGDICIPWSRYVVSNMATLVSNLNVKGKEFQSQLDRYVEYLLWTINAPSFDHCFWVYFLTLIFTG